MEEVTTKPTLLQDTLRKGLMLGGVHIVLFLTLYYVDSDMAAGFLYLFLILGINIGYCIYQGIEYRNELGGFMGFGTAFKHCFMILFVNGVMFQIFVGLLLLIEPSLPDKMADAQMNVSLYWAEKFGAPEATVEQMRDQFDRKEITDRYSPLGLLIGVAFISIFYALGGLIVGLITRKLEPVDNM